MYGKIAEKPETIADDFEFVNTWLTMALAATVGGNEVAMVARVGAMSVTTTACVRDAG